METPTINGLSVCFRNILRQEEIPKFRGAVITHMKTCFGNADILFHNHDNTAFRWRYPLIQYKSINGKATIMALGEGAKDIGLLLSSTDKEIHLGRRKTILEIDSVKPFSFSLQPQNETALYHVERWLPFNSSNYKDYIRIGGLKDRILFLERILTGNFLSMAKGLDHHIEKKIFVEICDLSDPFLITSKNVKMMAFDISFKSNLWLPDFIGIGKHASMGFGIIREIANNQ